MTILYVVWARNTRISKAADVAVRDCTSILAILADRWQNAECYRDCFEVLARAVHGASLPRYIDSETKEELIDLTRRVTETGVHSHVVTMLYEIAS